MNVFGKIYKPLRLIISLIMLSFGGYIAFDFFRSFKEGGISFTLNIHDVDLMPLLTLAVSMFCIIFGLIFIGSLNKGWITLIFFEGLISGYLLIYIKLLSAFQSTILGERYDLYNLHFSNFLIGSLFVTILFMISSANYYKHELPSNHKRLL